MAAYQISPSWSVDIDSWLNGMSLEGSPAWDLWHGFCYIGDCLSLLLLISVSVEPWHPRIPQTVQSLVVYLHIDIQKPGIVIFNCGGESRTSAQPRLLNAAQRHHHSDFCERVRSYRVRSKKRFQVSVGGPPNSTHLRYNCFTLVINAHIFAPTALFAEVGSEKAEVMWLTSERGFGVRKRERTSGERKRWETAAFQKEHWSDGASHSRSLSRRQFSMCPTFCVTHGGKCWNDNMKEEVCEKNDQLTFEKFVLISSRCALTSSCYQRLE